MIKKINVQKFGLFENYLWDSSMGRDFSFKKLNIIYGRNYSGKTTLSRIFRCFELSQLHNDYEGCKFSIKLEDNRDITHLNFDTFQNKVRVYNSDFVKDNLNWLHNDDGSIKPFTILGATNVEIDKRIGEIEIEIGNEENMTGLSYQHFLKSAEVKNTGDLLKNKKDSLNKKLTDKAREIKNKSSLYNNPNYQINTIKEDINSIKPESILDETIIDAYAKLLKEDSKVLLTSLKENKPKFDDHYKKSKDLCEKLITPSTPISDLINDAILQEWVRSGVELHKDVRESCGFCGSPLPHGLWLKLGAHFSQESEELRVNIKNHIIHINSAKEALSNFIFLNKEDFYSGLHNEFDQYLNEWAVEISKYNENLDSLVLLLLEREKDIFNSKIMPNIIDNAEELYNLLIKINSLIKSNNERTSTLSGDQQKARVSLRLNEVANFINLIDYNSLFDEIDALQVKFNIEEPELKILLKNIADLTEEKRILEAQAKDESKGAELVNHHLSHFFGHDELKLVAIGESPNIKFKIVRSDADAKNLSEGECSLISFCYFIAKIEDELKEETNTNQLILYIDDPISSLDSNHIFFMFSLIESIIAKPQKYNQLFISTHNLDFLKYLKKLTVPKERAQPNSAAKNSINHLMIERKSKDQSVLKFAPDYLKNYITEFNYLFQQMYHCAEIEGQQMDHNYHYNFGNNARKFLESYLFYKYPNHKITNDQRLELFFNNEMTTISLIRRVINEYSHLENQFDRGLEPIDEGVMKKVAKAILDKIKDTDPDQYSALVESIAA